MRKFLVSAATIALAFGTVTPAFARTIMIHTPEKAVRNLTVKSQSMTVRRGNTRITVPRESRRAITTRVRASQWKK